MLLAVGDSDRIVVLRHATAGHKHADPRDDLERELDPAGRAVAGLLPPLVLEHLAPASLLSSPYRRCRQTIEPLAALLGLPVITTELLRADTPSEAAQHLLAAVPAGSVLCTHGEWIERVLERRIEKGGVVVVTRGGHGCIAEAVISPPAPVRIGAGF